MNRRHAVGRAIAFAFVTTVGVLSCTDFTVPAAKKGPDVAVATPSFSADIQPIFTARCATSGCHNEATHQQDLVLSEGYAYDSLVNKPAMLDPTFLRVNPGKPDSSWLVKMISGPDSQREGQPQMPLGLTPLTDNQIGNIVRWIEQGAARN